MHNSLIVEIDNRITTILQAEGCNRGRLLFDEYRTSSERNTFQQVLITRLLLEHDRRRGASSASVEIVSAVKAAQLELAATHNYQVTDRPDFSHEVARGRTTEHSREIDRLENVPMTLVVTSNDPECSRCSTPPSVANS